MSILLIQPLVSSVAIACLLLGKTKTLSPFGARGFLTRFHPTCQPGSNRPVPQLVLAVNGCLRDSILCRTFTCAFPEPAPTPHSTRDEVPRWFSPDSRQGGFQSVTPSPCSVSAGYSSWSKLIKKPTTKPWASLPYCGSLHQNGDSVKWAL